MEANRDIEIPVWEIYINLYIKLFIYLCVYVCVFNGNENRNL